MNVVISQVNNVWFVGHNMAQDALIDYSYDAKLKGRVLDTNCYLQKINSNYTANSLSNQFEL
jgi:hypothetical protein